MRATAKRINPEKTLRPDAKGRITLGALAKGVSSFHYYQDAQGRIVLEPQVEVPAREAWVFKNPKVLAAIRQGLKESAARQLVDRESFAKYADDEID